MLTAKNVVNRYKLAKGPRINWIPYNKDGEKRVHVAIVGSDGEWSFDAVMKKDATQWTIQVTVPSGVKGLAAGTYEQTKTYRGEKVEEAKNELSYWINDLRTKGTIALHGWKKV